jgi:outer membrane protein insertion porin family/translocation and assembly module TamA
VRVEILIDEGKPVILRRVDIHGLDGLSDRVVTRAREAVDAALRIGQPFEEDHFATAAEELAKSLGNAGHAYVKVTRAADVDLPRSTVAVGFWVVPGRVARYGEVEITGLVNIPEEPVRRALDLKQGDPYSVSELEEAERQLLNLGVFSSVEIVPDLERASGAEPERVPIVVRTQPAKLRAVHLGGGLQIDAIKTDVHLTAGWENRNFLGGLRKARVEFTPGVVLYPTRIQNLKAPERLLPLARLRAELRQPGFLEARTNAFLRGEFSIYPVLLTSDPDPNAPVLGYRDVRAGLGLDRTLWRLYGALSFNAQVNSPFAYLGERDPDLHTVLVLYPELLNTLDLRNDRVHPRSGAYLANTLQVAGFGGDARDVKVQPEVRTYFPVDDDVTLGMRGSVGFLFPNNYGDTLLSNALEGNAGTETRAQWVRDVQLTFLRGFFAGGSGSNRGYGAREIGPHGVVPFYNPGQSEGELAVSCEPSSPDYDEGTCDLPLGGLTLWEASVELRFPLSPPLFGALFTDAADVSAEKLDLRFNRPHLSVGGGIRYETPVGPIRADIGIRIPGLQAPDSADEPQEPTTTFGLPLALTFGIGESF